MNYRITSIIALTCALLASPAYPQDNAAGKKDKSEAAAETGGDAAAAGLPESVKKLSAADRKKLQDLLTDASAFIGGIRIQEAFEKIIDAEAMAPDLFQIHNLKGAAYTKIRDFPKARKSFERSLELNPTAFMSKFNITELDFVEHKHADAEKNFSKLLAESPDMNLGTRRLIEFKILITLLKQDKDAEAKAIQDKFNFMEDTPAYYFGNAAIAFDAEDEEEARGWIRSAEKIYSAQEVSVYVDSFIEMGWIDNLQ